MFKYRMFGYLNRPQRRRLKAYIAGKHVWDLGAGDLSLTYLLVELGAKKVTAVDRSPIPATHNNEKVETIQAYFDQCNCTPEVAFVSWPVNTKCPALIQMMNSAKRTIYLGKNTDGTACGCPDMFKTMLHRKVLTYVPSERNTLIVYGKHLSSPREPLGEERAGMDDLNIMRYDLIERETNE